ncbi:MAG: peptide chain release factor 1 [Candidatus Lokiarchaeota archaeon]|nr:peptide chain release factor 1 [Candidatus Lokiarchaeota archaeon]
MSTNKTRSSFEKYKLKKMLKLLKGKKGFHSELTSLYCPPEKPVSDITNYLKNEFGQAANIKSKTTRKIVQESITKITATLRNYGRLLPENGLAIFSGGVPAVPGTPGTEIFELHIVYPPEKIPTFKYVCASEFFLEPLEDMLVEKDSFGLIVIDRSGCTIASLSGSRQKILQNITSHIPSKHHAGGQSQRRFERLIEQAAHEFFKKCGDQVNEIFVPLGNDLKGVIVGGAGPTKEVFVDSDYLDYRLKDKILDVYDIGYTGIQGIKELTKQSEKLLENVQIMKEKNLIQKFLGHIGRDTGLATYGEKEVRDALNKSAVETLLISENVDILRATIQCNNCDFVEEKTIHSNDLIALEKEVSQKSCPKCSSQLIQVTKTVDLIEELGDLAAETGARVEVVSIDSEEGSQLWYAFRGIGAILRYKLE